MDYPEMMDADDKSESEDIEDGDIDADRPPCNNPLCAQLGCPDMDAPVVLVDLDSSQEGETVSTGVVDVLKAFMGFGMLQGRDPTPTVAASAEMQDMMHTHTHTPMHARTHAHTHATHRAHGKTNAW